jgi:hypothetical protein
MDQAQTRNRRLVLHFDINSTILMRDKAKNITAVTHMVTRIIAKSAWGRLIPAAESDENQVPHWQLAFDQLSWSKP